MKSKGKEFVGRGVRGRNAFASVSVSAERSEEGNWTELPDARILFPPDGYAEVRGIAATSMSDGDWYIYQSAPNDRHRAPIKFKAVNPRRLLPFIDVAEDGTEELRRRLLVEVGMEDGAEGDAVVRISPDEVVRLRLERGGDGRVRARGADLAALPVRSFVPDRAIRLPGQFEGQALYDYQGCEPTGRTANWSSDAEYVLAAVKAVSASKPEVSSALAALIEVWARNLDGRFSASGGTDANVLSEIARSGALAKQLRADGAAMEGFRQILLSDPSARNLIEDTARTLAEQQRLALEESVRADLQSEMEAARAAEILKTRGLVEEIEAEGLAAAAVRRDQGMAGIEAELTAARTAGMAEVETSVTQARSTAEAEVANLERTLQDKQAETEAICLRLAELQGSAEQLGARESELLGKIEKLSSLEQSLASRSSTASFGVPKFHVEADEPTFGLDEVRARAESFGILNEAGVDAVVRLAVFAAAGEIPMVTGESASDLIEIAGLVLSGGRVAGLHADPTLVTFEDLWSRPGGNGPTALAAAAQACCEGSRPAVLAAVHGAERSGARFWLPPLADAYRRGVLPPSLILCVTVEDAESEEAQAIARIALVVEADGTFAEGAFAAAPLVFEEETRHGKSLRMPERVFDPAVAVEAMQKHGRGLRPVAARRLAAIGSAARRAGKAEADALTAEAAKALRAAEPEEGVRGRPYIVSSNGNA